MPSSSTTLLQKILISKLEPWIDYVNGEGKTQYILDCKPDKIIINEYVNMDWQFPVATLIFDDRLCINTRVNNDIHIEYADPSFYKKVFETLNKAIERKNQGLDFIVNLTKIVSPSIDLGDLKS